MLKRTKGRILLTLLVVTGMAGTVNNTSLSTKERKFVLAKLKDARNELFQSITGLSAPQLDFKISPQQPSIRECFYDLVSSEKLYWETLEKALKQPARPEKRNELNIADDQLFIAQVAMSDAVASSYQKNTVKWISVSEAVSAFKSLRMQQLKYIKTTTSDLRNRFVQLPSGWVDCYQYMIYIAEIDDQHIQRIQEILAYPGFPKK